MEEKNNIQIYHRSIQAMNSQLDVIFWAAPKPYAESAFSSIVKIINELELVISRYNNLAETYLLNQNASKRPVAVSDRLWKILLECDNYFDKTKGYFDVSLGDLYHQIKSGNIIDDYASSNFRKNLILDENFQSVAYTNPNTSIDFGGIGKGIALDSLADVVDRFEIQNTFISFGGSSVLTRGKHPHGDYWPFSLAKANEDEEKTEKKTWKLNNDCISVSNSTLRIDDELAHIINPENREAVKNKRTVVVKSNKAADAEVLSTALVAAPVEKHEKINKQFRNCSSYIIES